MLSICHQAEQAVIRLVGVAGDARARCLETLLTAEEIGGFSGAGRDDTAPSRARRGAESSQAFLLAPLDGARSSREFFAARRRGAKSSREFFAARQRGARSSREFFAASLRR